MHAARSSRGPTAWRGNGGAFPEVNWPVVVAAVLPEFGELPASNQAEFSFQQMQIGRTLQLFDGASQVLRALKGTGRVLGIVSNAQAYILRELAEHLSANGLGLDLCERELSLWSFQNGFSKPDPNVMQMVVARLEPRGIRPAKALMVGDRLDNDIEPARNFGFQTWQLCEESCNRLTIANCTQLGKHLAPRK